MSLTLPNPAASVDATTVEVKLFGRDTVSGENVESRVDFHRYKLSYPPTPQLHRRSVPQNVARGYRLFGSENFPGRDVTQNSLSQATRISC